MSKKLTNAIGPAFAAGGLLWIAHYAIWIAVGLSTGESPVWGTTAGDAAIDPVGYLDLASFCGAILCFAAGLFGLGATLRGRSKVPRGIGLFFAALAGLMAAGGLVGQVLNLGPVVGLLMGNGVMAVLLGTTLLAAAALRAGGLPRATAPMLLANGLLTFPLIVGITAILPALPGYAVDELPFAVSGLAWIGVGLSLLFARGEDARTLEPAVR